MLDYMMKNHIRHSLKAAENGDAHDRWYLLELADHLADTTADTMLAEQLRRAARAYKVELLQGGSLDNKAIDYSRPKSLPEVLRGMLE